MQNSLLAITNHHHAGPWTVIGFNQTNSSSFDAVLAHRGQTLYVGAQVREPRKENVLRYLGSVYCPEAPVELRLAVASIGAAID